MKLKNVVSISIVLSAFFVSSAFVFAQDMGISADADRRAGPAHDPDAKPRSIPAWQETQTVDVSAFRYTAQVTAPEIAVPTVVELTVSDIYPQNKSAVVMDSSGIFQPAFYKRYTEYSEVPVLIEGNMVSGSSYNLTDGNFNTTADFPFTEGETNIVSLVFVTNKNIPITTSELHIVLAPHVALPKTVRIDVGLETTVALLNTNTVVSKTALYDTVVRFPEVTASRFIVEFELAQPLRLAEIAFVQKTTAVESDAIRFLAQPGERYSVFVDPDRSYGLVTTGGISLADNRDVLQISGGVFQTYSGYAPSDTDKDAIPDRADNCVAVPNGNQIDIDGNGRGDVCDDFDRDGLYTDVDNCPETPNSNQRDTDADGIGDVCDDEESRLTEKNPLIPWAGMAIAALVLIGLMAVSLRSKPLILAEKDEEKEETSQPQL